MIDTYCNNTFIWRWINAIDLNKINRHVFKSYEYEMHAFHSFSLLFWLGSKVNSIHQAWCTHNKVEKPTCYVYLSINKNVCIL